LDPNTSERFGRDRRLTSSRDFDEVKRDGTPYRGRYCVLLVLASPGETTRVGFVASKRGVGGAVDRNRARRRLREIVRRRFPRLPGGGFRLVLIAGSGATRASHQDLASDVERLLAAAGALTPLSGASQS
jgi:ribonuclease P protein component